MTEPRTDYRDDKAMNLALAITDLYVGHTESEVLAAIAASAATLIVQRHGTDTEDAVRGFDRALRQAVARVLARRATH